MSQRVVVLGGGPAGDVAALRAAQLGADVTLVERAELGGTCLNWGCIPTKSLLAGADLLRKIRTAAEFGIRVPEPEVDFPRMMERKEEVVLAMRRGVEAACKRRNVAVVRAQGLVDGDAVVAGGTRHEFDHLVVCVGTEPSGLPGIDMEHPLVVTSNGILRLERVPDHMLVIGGGVVGCEFASLFAALGSRVTVVEVLPQVLAGVDPRVVVQWRRIVEKQGITFLPGRRVESVDYAADTVTAHLDDSTTISADLLLVSVGRRAQTRGIGLEDAGVVIDERDHIAVDPFLRTANPRIWAAGDCIGGLQLAHLGSAEGGRAVENALGHDVMAMDRTVVPSCIYTHPEIAMVGMNPQAAEAAGIEVKLGQARYLGNGKALGEGEPDGLAQLYADAATDRLIGATIMGAHAVEIIHEVGVAISDGLSMDDLGSIIHAHPTVSELMMDAAEQGEKVAPYLS
jgi:dihydrolipoamide dehydrogenase